MSARILAGCLVWRVRAKHVTCDRLRPAALCNARWVTAGSPDPGIARFSTRTSTWGTFFQRRSVGGPRGDDGSHAIMTSRCQWRVPWVACPRVAARPCRGFRSPRRRHAWSSRPLSLCAYSTSARSEPPVRGREKRDGDGDDRETPVASGGGGGSSGRSPRLQGEDLRRLMELARPQRWRLTAALCFLVVSSTVTMSAPFFLGKVIDTIYMTPGDDFKTSLTSLCAMLSGVFLTGAAANAIRIYLIQTSGQQIVRKLRESLFSSILRQELGFFDKTRTGELINRLSADTARLGHSVTDNLSDGLRAVAQATAGVGMMFYVSPNLAAFVLMVVPPMTGLAVVYGRYLRSISKRTQDALAEATQLAEERIGNLRTVRAFGKELTEVEKYAEKVNYVFSLAKKEAVMQAGFYGLMGLNGNMMVLAVLYKGGLLMGSEHMTMGQLSSFLMYTFWVGVSVAGLSSFYSELMKGLGAGTRLWELLDRKPEFSLTEGLELSTDQLRGELAFRNVSFAYPTRKEAPIFQHLDLLVRAGSVMAVVGPSGSGKSTLVSLLLRLYDPDSGMITIDGHDVKDLSPYWLRRHIGTVSQEPILFSCSIAENIAYGAPDPSAITSQEIHHAARMANAYDFVQGFPNGFDTVVGEKGVLLSGGQKQRIAIARALLKNPKILLLDEATSALDAENELLVQEALERLMQNRTVLIIAHRLSTVQSADAVAVLDQGRVVECGQRAELLANSKGHFRRLMEKQSFLQVGQKLQL
ncbi:ATP-binding cassette sub-family B member 10, mitochondrial [Scleropages formosus]|uniref:ATP-binding cassette sub-family B member 10, mitochondrial n=1 Tax=Scleropages formosus TaxID=113540 RepID=A0A8C9U4M7_SCLFO|nr:ATP-binding cassette sub-family B member 10, mitochondrial [Scleropages formosus]